MVLAESPHVYYADRLFCVALSRLGPLVFDPAPDTLYRISEGNWTERQDPDELRAALRGCDRLIEDEASSAGIDLPELWRGYLDGGLPAEITPSVKNVIRERFSKEELDEHMLETMLSLQRAPFAVRVARRLRRAYRVLATGAAD